MIEAGKLMDIYKDKLIKMVLRFISHGWCNGVYNLLGTYMDWGLVTFC